MVKKAVGNQSSWVNQMYIFCLFIPLLISLNSCQSKSSPELKKPNILLILVDDMGYNALGSFGPDKPWKTPNIDKIAAEGMKFTHAYASPVCSPTRASIMTGKDPARVRVSNWIPGWADVYKNPKLKEKPFNRYLPLNEFTLAEALKKEGYATALIGKWHLGEGLHHQPNKQGFDHEWMLSFGNLGNWFVEKDDMSQVIGFNRKEGDNSQFLTEHLVNNAIDWMNKQNDPFFLFFSTHVVHKPIAAKQEILQKYIDAGLPIEGPDAADYAAMHEHMDNAIGRLLNEVKVQGLEENTIVLFLSDNGGRVPQTDNAPFSGSKGTLLEGGVRVPFIVKWPGKIKPGSATENIMVTHDLYPTILELIGSALLPQQHKDGVSQAAVMLGKQSEPVRENVTWHYPHYTSKPYGKPSSAIRKGKWKLIEVFEFDGPELYDLSTDPGEHNNLAVQHPEVVKDLISKLNTYREEIDAQMPTPNPEYVEGAESGWPEEKAN